ncbi:MAG: hypothetical protein PV358_10170, partial [Acidimicrobiales bacterium]|nr:hypothetical protein [Acidimicrobiales bacterium]
MNESDGPAEPAEPADPADLGEPADLAVSDGVAPPGAEAAAEQVVLADTGGFSATPEGFRSG